MREALNASLIVRLLTKAAGWLDRQWEKSFLALLFSGQPEKTESPASLFGKFAALLRSLWYKIFHLFRFDRLLAGSVFERTFFWCALTVALGPIMPTMVTVGLALLGFVAVMVPLGRDKERKLRYSPVNRWAVLYVFVYLVATFTSVTPMGSLRGGLLTAFIILFTVAMQTAVTERRQIDTLFELIAGAAFVIALYGFYQVLAGVESSATWIDKESFSDVTLRVYSFLGNPNVLSEYLLLVIPICAACMLTAETPFGRLCGLAATGATVVAMALTLSRGGYLGLLVAAAVFLVLMDRRFIVLGIAGLIALVFVLPDTILARFASITNLADTSTNYRLSIWLATLNMLRDYWFCGIGTGFDPFAAVYPAYSFNAVVAPHSHNLYLQVIVECGVLGFITLMGSVLSFLRACGSALRRAADRRTRIQLIALISAIAGFLTQSLTDYSFYHYAVTLMFWTVISLGAMLSRPWREETV